MKPELLLYLHILVENEGRCTKADVWMDKNNHRAVSCSECGICGGNKELDHYTGTNHYNPIKVRVIQQRIDFATEEEMVALYKYLHQ